MPFCPRCRSEFLEGVATCRPCGGEPLVEALPELRTLGAEDLEGAQPVGFASSAHVARMVEIEGRTIDLMRVFPLAQAKEMAEVLSAAGVPSVLVPVPELDQPGQAPRFEVRVRAEDHQEAEAALKAHWAANLEEGAEVAEVDAEHCPACGAHVPLDQEECPECGLVVGAGGEDEEEAEG